MSQIDPNDCPSTDRYGDTTTGRGTAYTVNMNAMTLEEEALIAGGTQSGWTRINMPFGEHAPLPAPMIGMRGEKDADDDQSYGPGANPKILTQSGRRFPDGMMDDSPGG